MDYMVHESASDVLAVDANYDGATDLAVLCSRGVCLLINDGDGQLLEGGCLEVDQTPVAGVAVDMNADGRDDLAIACCDSKSVEVLLSDGDGWYEVAGTIDLVYSPDAICAGDFDGDNEPDLAVVGGDGGFVSVMYNQGGGNLLGPVAFQASGSGLVFSGDYDLDGDIDIATPGSILWNNGSGWFLESLDGGPGCCTVDMGDVDGDGDLDFYGDWGNYTVTFRNNGDGTFTDDYYVRLCPGGSCRWVWDLELTDLDGDGGLDILTTGGEVCIQIGSPCRPGFETSCFGGAELPGDASDPYRVLAADISCDGQTDVVVFGGGTGISLFVNKSGNFDETPEGGGACLIHSDFNRDGVQDQASYSIIPPFMFLPVQTQINVVLSNEFGGFDTTSFSVLGLNASSIAVADLYGTGIPIVALLQYNKDNLLVFSLDGNPIDQYPIPPYARSVVAGDFNADGGIELALACDSLADVVRFWIEEDGTLSHDYVSGVEPGVKHLLAADVTDDGFEDLVVSNRDRDLVIVLVNRADGSLLPRPVVGVGGSPTLVFTDDLDGDGRTDMVVTNPEDKVVSVIAGLGNDVFSIRRQHEVEGSPLDVCAADFDGDGRKDLAVANSSPNVSLLIADPYGGYYEPTFHYGLLSPANSVFASDVNDDGAVDLLVGNSVLINILGRPTPVEDELEDRLLPQSAYLRQNYPNPFNATTVVEFDLPSRSQVALEVFNILGQQVAVLADGEYAAGSYRVQWDGTTRSGRDASTGVYFCRLRVGDFVEQKKMLLLK